VVLAEVGLLSAVDLGESDVLLLEGSSGLLVLGGKGLAVAAPGSEDCRRDLLAADGDRSWAECQSRLTLSKDEVVVLDELVKGVLGQLCDI
jgi:hypothetical protein